MNTRTTALHRRTTNNQVELLLNLLSRASVIPKGEHPEDPRMLVVQESDLLRTLKKAGLKLQLRTGETIP